MALAVRGERGSQRFGDDGLRLGAEVWRSPFAASEDRNTAAAQQAGTQARWRWPFAASEDRNVMYYSAAS